VTFDDADEPELDHATVLEAVIRHLLRSDDLYSMCCDADTAVLVDGDGDPIDVRSAETYANAGVMTLDRGVYLELSDGSCFSLTIGVSARGSYDTTAIPPATDHQQRHVPRPMPGNGDDPIAATNPRALQPTPTSRPCTETR
jgi:hypothetical protein